MFYSNQVSGCGVVRLPLPILAVFFWLTIPISTQAAIPQQERDALTAFYSSTNGAQWDLGHTWLGPVGSECGWSGVTCDSAQNTVLQLNITMAGGSISIPAGLGDLTNLQVLSISGAGALLNGDLLPTGIGNLKNLQELTLSGFDAGGGIPAAIGNLTNLTKLVITSCSFGTGTQIPAEIGNLTELTTLNLSFNSLRGSIPPSLGNLAKLQRLDLSYNFLAGIPAELGNLTNLQELVISQNPVLMGSIPTTLGNLTELITLNLSSNRLSGAIPPSLGNLTKLQYLYLSYNSKDADAISGPIPAELGNLKELNVLDLRNNRLSGAIPPALGNLTKLQQLLLNGNYLSGPIPAELGNLTALQTLYVDGNLTGPIPAALGNLSKLQTLYLHGSLTGSIPAELGNLTELTYLDLSYNHLAGSIPPALGNLTKLQTLALKINQLGGGIPAALGNLINLSQLLLQSNQLTGTIPSSLSNLTRLSPQNFDLSYNGLYAVDNSLKAFLDAHATWGNQTVAPGSASAQPESSSSLLVQWTPLAFSAYSGRYEVWVSATSGGPYTLAGATADKVASSLRIGGLSVGLTYYLVVRTVSDPNDYNQNTVISDFSVEISIPMAITATDLTLSARGAATVTTIGSTGPGQAGYAQVVMNSGNALYGIAVYSYRRDGITVSECGVPASPPTTAARIFVDYRTSTTIPGSSGRVRIDTGLALVNHGAGPATITYTLRNLNGQVLSVGTGSLAKDAHVARYLWELPAMVSGFSIPSSFPTDTGYGTLEIASDQPLSVLALRLTTNQRGEFLATSTPMADLTQPSSTTPVYYAQLVDGGGYTTSLLLMNTSTVMMTGMLRIYGNDGSPLAVQPVGGAGGSAFGYAIAPGGAYVFQTDAAPVNFNVGWVELIPDPGTPTPMGAGVYQSSQDGVLVAESGIAAAIPTTHARVFVDTTEGHNSSVAIGNPGTAPTSVAFAALGMDGSTPAGSSVGPMPLNGKGHAAEFVWQRISGLPADFRGVLDMASDTPFVPLTVRALVNERGNFLFTAFPVADMNQPAPSPVLFPQIAAGSGFMTEFILLSAGAPGSATLRFFSDAGSPLAIGK